MTLCHIALSDNTKKYIKRMKGLVHSNMNGCTKTGASLGALVILSGRLIKYCHSLVHCERFYNDTVEIQL